MFNFTFLHSSGTLAILIKTAKQETTFQQSGIKCTSCIQTFMPSALSYNKAYNSERDSHSVPINNVNYC